MGPILWRRCQEHSRHIPYFLGTLVLGLAYHALFAWLLLRKGAAGSSGKSSLFELLYTDQVIAIFIAFMIAALDFKADTPRLEWLKSLPIKASGVAAGQMALSSLFLAVFMSIGFLLNYGLTLHYFPQVHLGMSYFGYFLWSLPLGVFYISSANALFLLIPTSGAGRRSTIGLFQYLSGMALLTLVVVLVFSVIYGSAILSKHLGGTEAAFFALSTVAFVLLAAFAFRVVVWSYARFDVSRVPK